MFVKISYNKEIRYYFKAVIETDKSQEKYITMIVLVKNDNNNFFCTIIDKNITKSSQIDSFNFKNFKKIDVDVYNVFLSLNTMNILRKGLSAKDFFVELSLYEYAI